MDLHTVQSANYFKKGLYMYVTEIYMQTLLVASASSFACIISIWISCTYCLTRVGTGLQQARTP